MSTLWKKVGVVTEEDKPIAAYVVENPNRSYNNTKTLIKYGLALSIILTISLAFSILVSCVDLTGPTDEAFIIVFGILLCGLGITELIFFIVFWANWKLIKCHTNVSPLWSNVGYSVGIGVDLILFILLLVINNQTASLVISIFALLVDLFIVILSYWIHYKMKKTLHK